MKRAGRRFCTAASVIAITFGTLSAAQAEEPFGRTYQDLYPVDELTVPGGHFYTLVGYEVVQAPDNFFYSNSLTMFNSEPFTHTGFLGNNLAASLNVYGGWTLGWDTGFSNTDDSALFLAGGGSVSFPVLDRGNWAVRSQLNGLFSGAGNVFADGALDPKFGVSLQVYLQSISGNAAGIGAGLISEPNQSDTIYYNAFSMININRWTSKSNVAVGQLNLEFGPEDPKFWSIGNEKQFFLHQDMASIGLATEIGEVKDEWEFRYIGVNLRYAPNIQQAVTLTTMVGHVDVDFDNPFANDRDYWFAGAGIRIDLNEAQNSTGNPMTLRARQILNTPWDFAPLILRYGR